MRKIRVYVETSVINHLDAPDRPDWMADTLKLWAELKTGKYEIVVSETVFAELGACPEPKRTFMFKELEKLPYEIVKKSNEAKRLAKEYIAIGGVPKKSETDALHIALAVLANCDVIVSWNFSHIVNLRAKTSVNAVNVRERLKPVDIFPPSALLGGKR